MRNKFVMYKFALLKGFSYFCLLWAFVLCFVSSDGCISKPWLNKQSCTDFCVESGAAFYDHSGRGSAYYKCRSQPCNGTVHKTIFLLCCRVLVFTASGKGAQAMGSFTSSSVLYFNSFKYDRLFQLGF